MRVLLVHPRFQQPIETRTTPHLGLAYLAAVSLEEGHETMVWDADVEQGPVAEVVDRLGPDLVGITATTPQIEEAWRVAREVKRRMDVPVVIGGSHVSALPSESCRRPEVDVVVRREGEETWRRLCAIAAAHPRPAEWLASQDGVLDALPGISYLSLDGQERHNPDGPPIDDLDALPWPAFHLFRLERYTNLQPAIESVDGISLPIMTSRGCPYRCTFCSQSVMPRRWRARTPESILQEWQHVVEDLGAREIGVLDDCANLDLARLHTLADGLIERGLNRIPWILVNGIRADRVDVHLLDKLRRAGLKRVAFGVESGDPGVLSSTGKKLTVDQVRNAFAAAREAGLESIGFFILGLPGDTEESMERTIQLACELDPLVANFSMMTPYPGTEAYEEIRRQGRLLVEGWADYALFDGRARYEMGNLTAGLVEHKWKEAYRRFYLRPHRLLKTVTAPHFWRSWRRTLSMAVKTLLPRGAR